MFVRPTHATLDEGALRHNLRLMQDLVPGGRVMAVVKADAYGHGAVRVGRALADAGAWGLAVSLVEEGVALREAGILAPIVVLCGIYPGYEDLAILHDLTPVVWEPVQVSRLAAAVRRAGRRRMADIHIKVDTGMGRLGCLPSELPGVLEACRTHRDDVRVEGFMTHLACADEPMDKVSAVQLRTFDDALTTVAAAGLVPSIVHAANSAASLRLPAARYDLLRPGLALYGVQPGGVESFVGKPVLSWTSRVAAIRDLPAGHGVSYGHRTVLARPSRVAVVPVGYEDGYPRAASSRAHMLVHGIPVPVVGVVTMDSTMLDVSEVPGVAVGDEVTVIGVQGEGRVTISDVAQWSGMIPYEVMCAISARVPRV